MAGATGWPGVKICWHGRASGWRPVRSVPIGRTVPSTRAPRFTIRRKRRAFFSTPAWGASGRGWGWPEVKTWKHGPWTRISSSSTRIGGHPGHGSRLHRLRWMVRLTNSFRGAIRMSFRRKWMDTTGCGSNPRFSTIMRTSRTEGCYSTAPVSWTRGGNSIALYSRPPFTNDTKFLSSGSMGKYSIYMSGEFLRI